MSNPPVAFTRQLGPGGLELRSLPVALGEVRAVGDDEAPMIEGHGSVSNVVARIGGDYGFDEFFELGAWGQSIKTADVRSMFNHDVNWLLGRTKSGTLRLAEDDGGLAYEIDVNRDDPNAMSVHARVARGDVDGSSVWFRVVRDEWTYPDDDNGLEVPQRRILEGALIETGPVTFPAYEEAESAARSLAPVDAVLRAAGVAKPHRRAEIGADLLSDPESAEKILRHLFDSAPDLRAAVCACEIPGPAADTAPADERAAGSAQEPVAPALALARAQLLLRR